MNKFYRIRLGYEINNGKVNVHWPFDIYLCFDEVEMPIMMGEGTGMAACSCKLTPWEALNNKWIAHIEKSNANWILPFIERMNRGEKLDKSEVLNVYHELNDKLPKVIEVKSDI